MKYRNLLIIFSLSMILTSCYGFRCNDGLGEVVSTQFSFNDFNSIVVEGSADIFIEQSDEFKVILETNDDLIDLVKLDKSGDKLIIGSDDNICPQVLNLYIQMPQIEDLVIKGSGNIVIKREFVTENLTIEIDGSGDMVLNLNLDELNISINGSGDVELIGQTNNVECNINGSGDIDMEFFQSRSCDISINGSGDILANVEEELRISIYGSGDVFYSGEPHVVQSINGSGDIRKIKSK